MKRFSEQFNTKAQSLKLEAAERRELRERIVSYMEYHPLSASTPKTIGASAPALHYRTIRIPLPMLLKWSAAVSAIVLIVVPMLAERSVPGDSLYAIKVRFNEEVRSTLTLSPYEKVEWETERLNRRIAEAQLLASEGRLTEEVGEEMAAAVREHTENVHKEIEVLRQSDADNATLAVIELNTTLELQSDSLQGSDGAVVMAMAMKSSEVVEESNPAQRLADVIDETRLQQETEMASSSVPSYEKIMARVEINTTRAYELLNSLHLAPEDHLRENIGRRLQDVNRSIEKANSARSNNESAAQEQLLNTLQRTQKIIVFMTNVEAGTAMDLDAIVPVIPTPEEEQESLRQANEDIEKKVKILTQVQTLVPAEVAEKITYALQTVAEKQLVISTATDVTTAKHAADEAIAYLNDGLAFVEASGVSIETEEPVPVEATASTTPDIAEEAPIVVPE